jgi:hypothetical protein
MGKTAADLAMTDTIRDLLLAAITAREHTEPVA